MQEEVTWAYDERGNVIKRVWTDTADHFTIYEYFYDEENRLVTVFYKDNTGYEDVCEYVYDENGNVIVATCTANDGSETIREEDFCLVYVPYEYTEGEWDELMEKPLYW